MQNNLAENSLVVEFRAKRHTPDRADPETAKKAFAAMRADLGHDPMSEMWDEKMKPGQRRAAWLYAELDSEDGGYHQKWSFLTARQKFKVTQAIGDFAKLATRIVAVLS